MVTGHHRPRFTPVDFPATVAFGAAHASMTAPRFDELIHPSTRLSIVAMLAAADWVEFAFVRDELRLSDPALSKQLSTLEDAGYLQLERLVSDRRRRVRVPVPGAAPANGRYGP